MTRAAKITYSAALLIGFLIGAFVRFQGAVEILKLTYDDRLAAPVILRDFSYTQYKHADSEHAEAALLMFANFLEEMEKLHLENNQKQELVNTYTRLALLEDEAHNPDQSNAYMAKARYWYRAKGGAAYSDSQMKTAVQAWDARMDTLGLLE